MKTPLSRLTHPARCFVLATAAVVATLIPAQAQEETTDDELPKATPVLSINFASVDGALDHVGYVFDMVGRPEVADLINSRLANFRDLKGLDRTKPMGMMIFLKEGLVPLPVPVGYVPVEDIGELSQTVATTGATLKPVPGEDGYYEFMPERGGPQQVVLQHGYAFITENPENLEYDFVDPSEFNSSLSKRYDIAVSANLKTTPKAIKKLLLTMIRASAQTEMQQRDDEPDGGYRVRKANAENTLRFVENILTEGEEMTFGLKVDQEKEHAFIELVMRATPDSDFAEELVGGIGKPSYFHAAVDEKTPVSISASLMLTEYDKKTLVELFNFGNVAANRGISETPQETPDEDVPKLKAIDDIFGTLQRTVEEGHIDAFAQFVPETESRYVLIGGFKLVDAARMGVGLDDIFTRIQNVDPNTEISMAVDSHKDVVFHRITGKRSSPGEARLYGEGFSLYVGTDRNALWFAVGGDQAMPTLKAVIDRVEASKDKAPEPGRNVPFQIVVNMSQWVRFATANREEPGRFGQLALDAFDEAGSDVLRIDGRPIENGFRVRLQFEKGFMRLLAMAISRQIDRALNL